MFSDHVNAQSDMTTRRHAPPVAHRGPPQQALTEEDLLQLQQLLDTVPAPLEPLDVSMLDGFLCGVLLQPQRVAETSWLPHVTDADGRALPAGFDVARLRELVLRRHAELDAAIESRQWFDPWVFELDGDGSASPSEAAYAWVAGFATAMEFFPQLLRLDAQRLREPLALLYRHLDADDLEDADDLIEEIESLEPPADLSEAVEELVRATLLLADVSRPVKSEPARVVRPPRPRR
ncbi:YecA family protein [Rhizobacter sp. AJA081-3]|uniref:YecA/YgfB family protein n=1 Tax=Rhizobacter sp. AJA081-3 TaxID=2753607 RepID=UPI001FD79061|nr:YecA family protein [Rhizobacter sp. AJA081-3]